VAKVKAQTDANLKAGYIQAADAKRTIVRAERSYIGSGDPCKAACRLAQDLEDSNYVFLALNKEVDKMGADVSAITRQIAKADGAKGKPSDRAAAVKGLDSYIGRLKAMETSKAISAVAAKELTNAANAVKTALTAS
jgi:hypothetical protein